MNSEEPVELPHYAAVYQGLHCLLKQNISSEKEIQHRFEVICDASIYIMDRPVFIVCNFMENSMGLISTKTQS